MQVARISLFAAPLGPAIFVALLLGVTPVRGAPDLDQDAEDFFESEIRSLLAENCYKCHSADAKKLKSDFLLDSREGLLRGGESGLPAIVPERPENSRLLTAVGYADEELQMPPTKRLSKDKVESLRKWIAMGAPWPGADNSVRAVSRVSEEDRNFWSFKPPVRPVLPAVSAANRVRTPIDNFTIGKLKEKNLSLSPDADPRTLIRRLYFDLTGLPPIPEEVDSFLDAYAEHPESSIQHLVDRLLSSKHYGERWGRHWLDVAGWAESSLFIGDNYHPDFWRYRDYVIRSFNADKPYDRFLIEQLAGDELFDWREVEEFTEAQKEQLIATGFLRCAPDATDNQFITQVEKRYAAQQQAVEVACKALMGLTMNCVRCHSHKYDPIPQEDYYKVIGIFQAAYDPENWIPGQWNHFGGGPFRAVPLLNRAEREAYLRYQEEVYAERDELIYQKDYGIENKYRDQYLTEHLADFGDNGRREALRVILKKSQRQRSLAEKKQVLNAAKEIGVNPDFLKRHFPEMTKEYAANKKREDELKEEQNKTLPDIIWGLWDVTVNPSPTRFLHRGEFEQPRHEVAPGVLEVLDDPEDGFRVPVRGPHANTTGRRLAFAKWLTRPGHPLTARVMVNRIWQYHFGAGIVSSPDDFGARGSRPTHPELLDWLAVEFVESGWSIKHLHRLILLSSTYRQSSRPSLPNRNSEISDHKSIDPSNKLLWHYPGRRLEAEAIRDGMLAVSGLLDTDMFGKSVEMKKQLDGRYVPARNDPGRHRRSVYLWTKRTELPSFLTTFDAPIMDTNWPVRTASAVSQQALALMNDPFVLECSDHLAKRLLAYPEDSFRSRLDHAFELTYAREPEPDEVGLFEAFLRGHAPDSSQGSEERAWKLIAQALLSSNEFLYVE